MAIQKRFIHFKKFSDFNSKKLSANEANTQYTIGVSGAIQSGAPDILYQSYCWIKDTQQQWTHGQLYNGKEASGGEENVQSDWNVTDTSSDAYIKNKPTIPAAVTESTVSGWGFTKNTGTYSKPSGGIPKTDLASTVQTSLGKADTALQSYTEQYKGTITGVSANGTSVATSGVANIPAASTSAYGVTKLSSATNSTSTTLAATASAVKAAYDLANNYKGTVTGVKVNGSTKSPSSGTVDIGNVVTSVKINGSSKSPSSGVVDLGIVVTDISGKQDKLVSGTNIKTINGTSILGSGNIVISGGGGGSSSGSGAYAEVNHGTNDTTFALTPNTFHVWEEVSALTLTLGSETAGVANEFLFQFTSGATATTLTLPDDIKWANDSAPTIEPNMIYQVSVLKGMASVLEFNNAVVSSIFPATLTVGDNGELGVSVHDTLSEGVVLQDGDLTLIVDGENYSITEYELDYDFSNGGFLLLYLEDGPMTLFYILESSGEVNLYML